MRHVFQPCAIVLLIAVTTSCHHVRPDPPDHWASRIDAPGVVNLYRADTHLYRGGQPDDEGFAQLKAMGIRTVVNLRTLHSGRERCAQVGLDYLHIPVPPWHADDAAVIEFLKVAADRKRQPVFVFCRHGADRTGMMCAVYRVVVQDWSKDEAINEMTDNGFGFHHFWQNLIRYVRRVDVESMRKQTRP